MTEEIQTRIAFFLGFQNPFGGAGWRRVEFFAKCLRRKGYDPYVIGTFSPHSPRRYGSFQDRHARTLNSCPYVAIDLWPVAMLNIFVSFIYLFITFISIRPAVTIISVPRGECALGAYFASRISRSRVLFDYRDEWEDDAIIRSKKKLSYSFYQILKSVFTSLYRNADYVITVTAPMMNNLRERGIRRVRLVPNGADLRVFRNLDERGKLTFREAYSFDPYEFIIVFSGLIKDTAYYRPSVLIRAVRKVADKIPEVRLVLLGSHPSNDIMTLIGSMNLLRHVSYLGLQGTPQDVARILGMCDVGLIPYCEYDPIRNTIPAKLYEYCACGLPIIATVCSDSLIAKIIQDNGIGLFCKPGHVEMLADVLAKMYEAPEFRKRCGANARSLAEAFDRNVIAEDFLKIVDFLVMGK